MNVGRIATVAATVFRQPSAVKNTSRVCLVCRTSAFQNILSFSGTLRGFSLSSQARYSGTMLECESGTCQVPWLSAQALTPPVLALRRRSDKTDAGICHLTQATKNDFDALLKGVADSSTQEAVKRILEMADRVAMRREVLHTDFLTPPILKESMLVLEKLGDAKVIAHGGYPQAERCRLSVGHPDAVINVSDVIEALSVAGNFGFQPLSHGDFLGSILGTGIAREKLGDIIVLGEKGAQVLIVPELADFVIESLDKVGNVSVSCAKIPLDALKYEPPRTKTFKTVETSLRIDALASAGFKISRSKLVALIGKGDVRVNWNTVVKNGTILKSGDIVSVSRKGRLKIGEIHTTRKDKYAVELIRYL